MENVDEFSNKSSEIKEFAKGTDTSNVNIDHENVFRGCEVLSSLLKNKEWAEITRRLTAISESFLKPDNRKSVTLQILNSLAEVLYVSVGELKVDAPYVTAAVTETFRALRNSCVGEPGNQKSITEETVAVVETCNIIRALISLPNNLHNVTCLRVGTQFLGNLVVNNKETQPLIWNKCSEVLIDLLKNEDEKIANYSSMVIYNILLGCPDISAVVENYKEMLEILMDHAMMDSEFSLFTVELLLSRVGFLAKIYDKLNATHRLFVLEALHSMISADCETHIPVSSVKFLTEQFKGQSDCILKTCDKYVEGLEPAEVSKLLQFLASASANNNYRMELQHDKSLLICCSMLLRSIHSLGKMGDNHFSAIQKLADLSISSQNNDILEHPAFGFKSSLVQILGNLCWRHLENQNQVRELDCIPVLLDCCNVDARNPLIIQWVVLAIRNLCENNLENQAVIASMTRQGTVDSSVLREMGVTLNADDENKIIIVPLDRKTSP